MIDGMEIKFFPRDVKSGKAEYSGDEFVSHFINGDHKFRVTKYHGDFFFAEIVK